MMHLHFIFRMFRNTSRKVNPSLLRAEIKVSSVQELAKLRNSEQLQLVILQIEEHSKVPRKSTDIIGPVEADPEYQLIVEANNMAVKIDNEIGNYIGYNRVCSNNVKYYT